MATHDYNLANQDGASFRSDLNNALAAIVSNNSSSTAPATTFAHQIWVDTTANVIKQRNAANDAWVELWRIDGGFNAKTFSSNVTLNAQSDLRFADSDSSNWVAFQAPATVSSNVTWTLPDSDGSADQVLTTNGSGVLSFSDAGGVQDNITEGNTSAEVVDTGSDGHFKVVTEGTEALRVDSSQRVGIGETSMDGLLVIKGNSDAASTPSIRLKDGTDTREGWISNAAGDLVIVNGGDDNVPHCKITLFDGNIISFATANTERFRVGSSGQLGIGGATYGSSGQVLTSQGSSSAPQWATPSSPAIVQKVVKEYSTASTFTTPYLTFDNTIPQSSETHLLFTQTFTPVSTSNKLFLTAQIGVMDVNSGGNPLLVGIYDNQPGGASARAVAWHTPYPASYSQPVRCEYEVGGTLASSYTFSVRVGSTGATWAVNRRTDAQYFGGTVRTYLTIEEFS